MQSRRWLFGVLGLLALSPAWAAAPEPRNLTVEFRQVSGDAQTGASTYSAGSGTDAPAWEPQMLLVRNGEKAVLELQDAIPMQWVQSVGVQSAASGVAASPAAAASNGAGLTQALTWFDAGQRMAVQVHWSSGKPYASVQIEVQRSTTGERVGAELPRQGRASVSTTVVAPLAQWVTIASSGKSASASGSYRSDTAAQQQRLLQLRVMLP